MPRVALHVSRPHLIPIGGFLGAGKTTAVRRLATYLNDQGLRVGIITNDQGSDVVDSRLLRACGFSAEEISGGCFCCRFDELLGATSRLALQADVIVAEAVGSCTDLRATVVAPLRRLAADRFTVGPLSVVIDPVRALAELGLDGTPRFSPEVRYIYDRQMEEAELLVINKCDLLHETARSELRDALSARYPRATILWASARDGVGLETWFARLLAQPQAQWPSMAVDYEVYAAGEAKLGWLDAIVTVTATPPRDADVLLATFAGAMRQASIDRHVEVAHAKMTLESLGGTPGGAHRGARGGVGAISFVRGDAVPELTLDFTGPVSLGTFTVNLRAEAAPEVLSEVLDAAMRGAGGRDGGLAFVLERSNAFRPGRPTPTHRDADG